MQTFFLSISDVYAWNRLLNELKVAPSSEPSSTERNQSKMSARLLFSLLFADVFCRLEYDTSILSSGTSLTVRFAYYTGQPIVIYANELVRLPSISFGVIIIPCVIATVRLSSLRKIRTRVAGSKRSEHKTQPLSRFACENFNMSIKN